MQTKNKLILSVIRGNRGLSAGLGLLFFMLFLMIVTVILLPDSVNASVDSFMRDYGMPEAWVVTGLSPLPKPAVPGLRSSEAGLSLDIPVYLPGEEERSRTLRVFSLAPEDPRRFHTLSEIKERPDAAGALITGVFAQRNGLSVGDELRLATPAGLRTVYIRAVVSLPEAIVCARDRTSWQDASDFGFLYLQRKDMDRLFGTAGLSNYHALYFDADTEPEVKQELLAAYAGYFGSSVLSAELYEASAAKAALEETLRAMDTVCSCFPAFIFLIGIFFTALFMRQIVLNRRGTVGLLRALGCTVPRILRIFIGFALVLSAAALLPGIAAGRMTAEWLAGIFRDMYLLPELRIEWNIGELAAGLLAVIVSALLSCLISARSIAATDPCEAYGDPPVSDRPLPALLRRSDGSVCVKMALTSIFRNGYRFIQSAFSICACIVLMTVSILYCRAQGATVPAVFGSRLRYDCLVCTEDAEQALPAALALPDTAEAERVTVFFDTLRFGERTASVRIDAIENGSRLIVPEDRDKAPLSPGNGVVLDEWTARELNAEKGDTVLLGDIPLPVTGVARELAYCAQYISAETAEMLHAEPQFEIALRFREGVSGEAAYSRTASLPGYRYTVIPEHQRDDYLQMLRLIESISYILTGIALLLGVIILYSMVVSNLNARRYEYATLLALGLPDRRFVGIAAIENLLLYIAAVIPALPLSLVTANYVLSTISSAVQYMPVTHAGSTFALCAGVSLSYIAAGTLLSFRSVKRIDPAIALNMRE